MKQILILSILLFLASCGSNRSSKSGSWRSPAPLISAPMASGPISQACLASDRKARSRALCGCIQAVADNTLSGSQQRRAVTFYNDPQRAQEIRQSARSNDERFWEAYAAYNESAKSMCS